jgi:hypothetical protein
MSENTTAPATTLEETVTVESVVTELVATLPEEVTAYKIATLVNGAFTVLGIEKQIPTQMMYNYTRNGMIAKGKKGKASDIRYTKEETEAFVTKYVNKYSK